MRRSASLFPDGKDHSGFNRVTLKRMPREKGIFRPVAPEKKRPVIPGDPAVRGASPEHENLHLNS